MNQSTAVQLVAALGRGVVPPGTSLVDGDDLGLTRGDGCFDALRITNDADGLRVHHREPHLARLGRSAALLQIADAPAISAWNHIPRCSGTARSRC